MKTIWLIRVLGEGIHNECFATDRKEVANALLELLIIGPFTGDPVLDEQQQSELDAWLESFNDADEWYLGHWGPHDVGETGRVVEAFVKKLRGEA